MKRTIKTMHGDLDIPAFFPDGTYGIVKSLNSNDLHSSNVDGMIVNTFHLLNKFGRNNMKDVGGLHSLINWDKPIVSDSGGFQVFSLINENSSKGEIRQNEIVFRLEDGQKVILSPEKCIQMQFAIGSDIIMCLDHCTHPNDSYEIQKSSVETTIKWARKCREEYDRLVKNKKFTNGKPLLFGIIQGGDDKELRKYCAEELVKIGFDGFGFGGWPLDKNNNLITDILEYTASLMPDDAVKYAMGVGRPEEIVKCAEMGYNLFDCVIPTREARHNRLYVFNEEVDLKDNFYSFIRILDKEYLKDLAPIDKNCDCELCSNYSRSYLHHLSKIGDSSADRLATMHNLRFYTKLMEYIRDEK
jgi:tRNA-guanine transglycosylase, queuosine-34-forming